MADNVFFTSSLAEAFTQAGFAYPIGADTGHVTRFSTNSKKGDKAGYLIKFADDTGAAFGCNRSGASFIWQQRHDGQPTPTGDELKQARAKAAQARLQAEQVRKELHATTAKTLQTEREALPLATNEHPYAKAKGIQLDSDVRLESNGALNLPVNDGDGNLISVQRIYSPNAEGKTFKPFAKYATTKGGRFIFGELADGEDITLFEGYATTASGYESGIGACVCCFSGHNLATVAADLRKRYPNSFIRIGGDFDASSSTSADYAKAAEAEAMPNSATVFPVFSDGRNDGDFNDLYQFAGDGEVYRQLNSAGRATVNLCDVFPTVLEMHFVAGGKPLFARYASGDITPPAFFNA